MSAFERFVILRDFTRQLPAAAFGTVTNIDANVVVNINHTKYSR